MALARALAVNPSVLLLDEPFGALDATVRKSLRKELRRIHDATGVTTIFVTHDQEEALELADRVAILNLGQIEQVGTPDEVQDNPGQRLRRRLRRRGQPLRGPGQGRTFTAGAVELPAAGVADGTAVGLRPPARPRRWPNGRGRTAARSSAAAADTQGALTHHRSRSPGGRSVEVTGRPRKRSARPFRHGASRRQLDRPQGARVRSPDPWTRGA